MNFYNVRLSQIKTILTLFCAFFFFFEFLAVSSYSKSVTDLPNNDLKMTGVRGGVEVRGDSSRGWKRETGRYERENGSDMKEHDGKYEGSIDRIDETDNRRNDVAEMISETPTSSNALKPSPTLPSNFKASRVAPKGKTKFKSSLHSMEKKSTMIQIRLSTNLLLLLTSTLQINSPFLRKCWIQGPFTILLSLIGTVEEWLLKPSRVY